MPLTVTEVKACSTLSLWSIATLSPLSLSVALFSLCASLFLPLSPSVPGCLLSVSTS